MTQSLLHYVSPTLDRPPRARADRHGTTRQAGPIPAPQCPHWQERDRLSTASVSGASGCEGCRYEQPCRYGRSRAIPGRQSRAAGGVADHRGLGRRALCGFCLSRSISTFCGTWLLRCRRATGQGGGPSRSACPYRPSLEDALLGICTMRHRRPAAFWRPSPRGRSTRACSGSPRRQFCNGFSG